MQPASMNPVVTTCSASSPQLRAGDCVDAEPTGSFDRAGCVAREPPGWDDRARASRLSHRARHFHDVDAVRLQPLLRDPDRGLVLGARGGAGNRRLVDRHAGAERHRVRAPPAPAQRLALQRIAPRGALRGPSGRAPGDPVRGGAAVSPAGRARHGRGDRGGDERLRPRDRRLRGSPPSPRRARLAGLLDGAEHRLIRRLVR